MLDRDERFAGNDTEIRLEASGDGDGSEVAAIRADIRETRERMSHTVEDIGERLNPDRLKEQLKSNIHDATIGKAEQMARNAADRVDETRHSLMDSIRDNPVPAAMIGLGIGWMVLNGRRREDGYDSTMRRESAYGYQANHGGYGISDSGRIDRTADRISDRLDSALDRGDDIAHRAQDRVTEIAHDVRDTAADLTDRAQDYIGDTADRARMKASSVARDARHRAHRVEDRFEETLRDNPLAVGAAVAALGMAIGLAAPGTRRESEMMGSARDQVVDKAKHATREVSGRVREVVNRVAEEAEATMKDEAQAQHLI